MPGGEENLIPAKPPPPLNVPASNNTVKISVIDSTCRLDLPLTNFLQPDYTGKSRLQGPSLAFLIEHPQQKPILFDLGVRKDFDKLPSYPKWVEMKWGIHVEKDIATILKETGVDVDGGAIQSIIWSHHHWDHVGNPSTFPPSTELVVGPKFKQTHLPGYPTRKEATLLDSDFEGRETREVEFDGKLKIGRFHAYDYFGDGSFYLLDTPGHSVGHICGFARTTSQPDTFVFMGGDAAHHGGEFRPTEFLPIPKEVRPSPFKRRQGVCPGHLLQEVHAHGVADKPFYYVTQSFAYDKAVADWTLDGLGEFDAHENVLALMAHDVEAVDPPMLDFYPESINGWFEKDTARRMKWLFLGDFEAAVEAKEKGDRPFTWNPEASANL